MAPINPTTTMRIRAHYVGPLGSHTMLFHAQDGIDRAEFIGDVQDAIDQMVARQYGTTSWNTAEFADAGESLFFPMDEWTPIASASGISPGTGSPPSAFLQFGGRTTGFGVRVKLYLFETYLAPTQNMRYTAGEAAVVDSVITELRSVDNNIGAINGGAVVWYTYANTGQNDYLTHKARRT